jgi:NitT/TauT family transport system substrate-binding protein
MSTITFRVAATAAVLSAAMIGLACAEDVPAAWCAPLKEQATVRVSSQPGSLAMGSYWAADGLGYFAAENIKIEQSPINRSADAFPLLARGMLDAVAGGHSAGFFSMVSEGMKMRDTISLGIYDPKGPAVGAFVRKELVQSGEVKTVADMKGKRIAIDAPQGTSIRYVFSHWLATGGLAMKDIQLVEMPLTSFSPALKAGTIDGAFVSSAYAATLAADGQIPLGDQSSLAGDGFDTNITLMMAEDFLSNHRDAARAFVKAVIRANRVLQGDYRQKPDIVKVLSAGTKVPEKLVQENSLLLYRTDGAMNPKTLAGMQQYFIDEKSVKYAAPIPFDKLVDDQIRQEAVRALDQCPKK